MLENDYDIIMNEAKKMGIDMKPKKKSRTAHEQKEIMEYFNKKRLERKKKKQERKNKKRRRK